ncbi:hypothetical protein RSAG8_11842, partial [Rhizoctonia solani AG-8 WAC10335]
MTCSTLDYWQKLKKTQPDPSKKDSLLKSLKERKNMKSKQSLQNDMQLKDVLQQNYTQCCLKTPSQGHSGILIRDYQNIAKTE